VLLTYQLENESRAVASLLQILQPFKLLHFVE